MKDLMKTNCYDVLDDMIIVGSCLSAMQPMAFKELENQSNNIYEVLFRRGTFKYGNNKDNGDVV